MIYIEKAKDTNGVYLKGDFFDIDRLYFAIFKFTGYHGMDDRCVFPGCDAICESLLGLCYEMRHAWQGDRDLEQVYNGIHKEWFDDFRESGEYQDSDDDDESDDENDDDYYQRSKARFSRNDFPEVTEHNTYFSIPLSFPELIYYALILSDLLDKKDLFYHARKALLKKAEPLQEHAKEYYYFEAEVDVARITIFVQQAFHVLYNFIGDKKYSAFINKFNKIDDFTEKCDMRAMNDAIADYGMKEYEQDVPELLMRTLAVFLR